MVAVVTRSAVSEALKRLGVAEGRVVVVHASLSSFGYVVGGAATLCRALVDAVGPTGTVVMPGFTPQLCHPSSWPNNRRSDIDLDAVAAEMPAFDAARTPVGGSIGAVAECLRSWPSTRRSAHPHTSFLANGRCSAELVRHHPLEYRLSSHSPLGGLCDLDATVLLLGVPWHKCTALHLSEYEVGYPGRRRGRWPVPQDSPNGITWRDVDELMVWEGDFDTLGADLCASAGKAVTRVTIGAAECLSLPLRVAAAFAADWLPMHRDLRRYADGPGWSDVVRCNESLPPSGVRNKSANSPRDGADLIWEAVCQVGRVKRRPRPSSWPPLR